MRNRGSTIFVPCERTCHLVMRTLSTFDAVWSRVAKLKETQKTDSQDTVNDLANAVAELLLLALTLAPEYERGFVQNAFRPVKLAIPCMNESLHAARLQTGTCHPPNIRYTYAKGSPKRRRSTFKSESRMQIQPYRCRPRKSYAMSWLRTLQD